MKEHEVRLEEVRQAFVLWREQKDYSTQPVPLELWQMAVDLMDVFPMPRIAVALKVSIRNLEKQRALLKGEDHISSPADEKRAKRKQPEADPDTLALNVTRIDLPADLQHAALADNGRGLTITRGDFVLRIPYDSPATLATTVVASFVGGIVSC